MRRLQRVCCVVAAASLWACERTVSTTEQTVEPATCFTCHSDEDTKVVAAEQQYEFSVHASGTAVSEPDGPCSGCHTSEGFVIRLATGIPPATVENPTAITCFTCHEPHTTGTLARRLDYFYPLANGETWELNNGDACTACHQGRRDVDTYVRTPSGRVNLTSRFGPHHGPQTDVLIGSNGYEYAGYTYEQSEHRTATEDGCLDCHMKHPENLRVGGHSFNMTYDDGTEVLVNVAACADCHGDLDDFDYNGAQSEIDSLVTNLGNTLVAAGLVSATTGLPRTVANVASDSAGAVFNYMMAKEDRSWGVHNLKYMRGLLTSAQLYMDGDLLTPSNMAARRDGGGEGSR